MDVLLGQNSGIPGSLTKYYSTNIISCYNSKLLYPIILLPPVIKKCILGTEWVASNVWLPFRESLAASLGSLRIS